MQSVSGRSVFLMFVIICLLWVGPTLVRGEDYLFSVQVNDTGTIRISDDSSHGIPLMDTVPKRTPLMPNQDELEQYVRRAAGKYDLPEALIFAVIRAESFGDHKARSEAGAMGLMQLMPTTAEQLGIEQPFDPKKNIMGGTKYLADLIKRFDGNLDHALAAYNAGPTRVEKAGGIPNIDETRSYVQIVREGFEKFEVQEQVVFTYRDEDGQLNITNLKAQRR